MPTIKFSLTKDDYDMVIDTASKEGISIQDYIRNKVLNFKTIYTPSEAVNRAKEKYKSGEIFTLPDIYGDKWELKRGYSGVFGKQFYNYVLGIDEIRFAGMTPDGRHAQYTLV